MDFADFNTLNLETLFTLSSWTESKQLIADTHFERREYSLNNQDSALLDRFPLEPNASCCFLRLGKGTPRVARISISGAYRLVAGTKGSWLLLPTEPAQPYYWLPLPPILRKQDALGHILEERPAPILGFNATQSELSVDLAVLKDWALDWVAWRFEPEAAPMISGLEKPGSLESRQYFLWSSKVNVTFPNGVYDFLLYGQVYTNDFVWPRKWKFYCEHDAYEIYVALAGLQTASSKSIYALLKIQLIYSVIARQNPDGGWYHGEWTDLMESHYRSHNAAILMLAMGLAEYGDETIRTSITKAARFLSGCADKTAIGHWFLHDSLENSAANMEEMRRQTNTPWIPTTTLGKSPTNKLILNTHLDAIVTLERYRDATGDSQYADLIASARRATRSLLAMCPAEPLYRLIYKAIYLTLLPKEAAVRLPLPLRIIKRLTWMYLMPRMHRVKRAFPRIVMPGGIIERHIAALHYDANYHSINTMDLARYWRRFPEEDLAEIIHSAVNVVMERQLLEYWSSAKPRQLFSIVEWADALYHLCTISQEHLLRAYLAQTLLFISDCDLGLPPSILGGDAEAAGPDCRIPCPSPANRRLLVANLSRNGAMEILIANPANTGIELAWEAGAPTDFSWHKGDGGETIESGGHIMVPARSWIIGTHIKYPSQDSQAL